MLRGKAETEKSNYVDFDKINKNPDFNDFDDDEDRDFDEVVYIYEYEDESKVFKELSVNTFFGTKLEWRRSVI